MNTVWIAFAIGFFLGGFAGVLVMCLCFINKQQDNSRDRM